MRKQRIGVITSDPDPVRQASLLRDELLRVIDANVALEHEMDALRHQLMMATDRSDRLEAELAAHPAAADIVNRADRPSGTIR